MDCIITHGDLDGLASAALLYDVLCRSYGRGKPSLRIAQPFTLHDVLRAVDLASLEGLYILDIGVDQGTWSKVRNELTKLSPKALKLWIDHHKATISKVIEFSELGVSLLYAVEGCTSTIMREAFLNMTSDPEFYAKVALIGEVGDKVRELKEDDPLFPAVRKLGAALSYRPEDNEFKVSLVKMWVNEKILINEEVERRAAEASKRFKELSSMAESKTVFCSEALLILDFREVEARGFVGKIASDLANKTGKVVFIAFNSGPYETVVTARAPKDVGTDVSELLRSIASKVGGSGGGHPKAASIRFPSFKYEEVIEGIKRSFKH